MAEIVSATQLQLSLLDALRIPKGAIEFSLHAKAGELVTITGIYYASDDDIQKFERVFRDKAEFVEWCGDD